MELAAPTHPWRQAAEGRPRRRNRSHPCGAPPPAGRCSTRPLSAAGLPHRCEPAGPAQVRRGPRGRDPPLAAGRAETGHLEAVAGGDEAVRARDPLEPRIELAVGELDDAVAAGADEMVVVALAAPPVAEL